MTAPASELDQSRHDAVQEIAGAICLAASDVLAVQGGDPHSWPILAAGFTLAIDMVDRKINPGFKTVMREMLK